MPLRLRWRWRDGHCRWRRRPGRQATGKALNTLVVRSSRTAVAIRDALRRDRDFRGTYKVPALLR
jgi:hypothetical protein